MSIQAIVTWPPRDMSPCHTMQVAQLRQKKQNRQLAVMLLTFECLCASGSKQMSSGQYENALHGNGSK